MPDGSIRLAELRDGTAYAMLPEERDPAAWHQALTAAIAAHLSPAHAALLGSPVRTETGLAWFAPGSAMRRFADLSQDDRHRLQAATGVILSDIRRLAESGIAPAVSAAWPALRSVPDLTHLFAVEGRPVLSGWGFAARDGDGGPLAAWDDGVPWHSPPSPAWRVYGAALAAMGALALLAGLVVAPLWGLFWPADRVCRAAPGEIALVLETAREADRTALLREQLAQLQEDHGGRALQCPIPRVAVLPPPPPTSQQAQVCVGDWQIGIWVRVTSSAQGLAPETMRLPFDPAVTLPTWGTMFTRFTRCGAFHQQRSVSTRQGRLPDGRSVMLNSIIAEGPDGSHICYEYWDAYRHDGGGWVRDAVKLEAVVLTTPQGVAVAGSPTAYCAPPAPSPR